MVLRKRLNLAGHYTAFLTTTVNEWIPVFSIPEIAILAVRELENTAIYYNSQIMAYVIMPDHIHILINFNNIKMMSKYMQCYKSITSRKIHGIEASDVAGKIAVNSKPSLWMPRFDDFIIRNKKQFEIKLNYIHYNPVRAGIVEYPCDYPYSSARDWLLNHEGLIKVCKNI